MKSKLTNTSGASRFFAYINEGGATLANGAYVEMEGDIRTRLDASVSGTNAYINALNDDLTHNRIQLEYIVDSESEDYEDCFTTAEAAIATIIGDGAQVTVTTTTARTYVSGMTVVIFGTGSANLDGAYEITVVDDTTFTYVKATADVSTMGLVVPNAVWEGTAPTRQAEAICRLAVTLSTHLGVPIR